ADHLARFTCNRHRNPRFRRCTRFLPMIFAEESSRPEDRRCLRFKCSSFYELNAMNTLPVHDLSAVRQGTLKLRLEHTYPLVEAAQAHRDLEARRTTGKILLVP